MGAHPDYPFVFLWKNRHGKDRWRFRRGKTTIYLPGEPGEATFDDAYERALDGRQEAKTAQIIELPGGTIPGSLKAAWRVYTTKFPEWKSNGPATKAQQIAVAETFLTERLVPESPEIWGDQPVKDLKRKHIRAILAAMSDRPHAGRHRLTVIRKMIMAAIEEEWIETDPAYKLRYRPETIAGFRAWADDEMAAFEKRWIIGTTPRLVYEMALWLGPRRCDLARLRPADIHGDVIAWTPSKTQHSSGTPVVMPITKWLEAALNATDLSGPTIVKTQAGKPFSVKSLTGRMRDWTGAAGLTGCTLHGLRKTLGKRVTDAKGTTRQAMAVLGHETLQQVELYSRDAEREGLARDAMEKVVEMVERRKKTRG